MPSPSRTLTEKSFYLAEFRERCLAIALPGAEQDLSSLEAVLADLRANRTRVLLISAQRGLLTQLVPGVPQSIDSPDWLGRLWTRLRGHPLAALELAQGDFARQCRQAVLRLRPAKLVWLDECGGLRRHDGGRVSVLDLADLEECVGSGRVRGQPLQQPPLPLLAEIRAMIAGGVAAVNLCCCRDLAQELFTYAGSGSLCTRERYVDVRGLALDEFDAAADLLGRGVEEGFLVIRDESAVERLLCHGIGVFLQGRHLAGIGALLPHAADHCGELAALYTLTRYSGEGVGGHLIRFALERAREREYTYVFACTTSERVAGFFERQGFERVPAERIPDEKWRGYDAERRDRVLCLRRDLPGPKL